VLSSAWNLSDSPALFICRGSCIPCHCGVRPLHRYDNNICGA